jgi:hypothetical protein
MRCLRTSESAAFARDAFRLARAIRLLAAPLLVDRAAPVDQLWDRARIGDLPAIAGELRTLLAPAAYRVEETELFRLVGEMEAEASSSSMQHASWSRFPIQVLVSTRMH